MTAGRSRGLIPFLAAQATSSFNDNAFKTFVALLAVRARPDDAARFIAVAGALFILPFLLFSTLAGEVADRRPKAEMIRRLKGIELALLLLAAPALGAWSVPALMALLFLMGTHSAFFGPVKLSILPELVEDGELSNANGLVQMTSFGGIVLGTAFAAALVRHAGDRPALAGLALAGVALAGLAAAWLVPQAPAARPDAPLPLDPVTSTLRSLRRLAELPTVNLATYAAAFFWFTGALFQMNLLVYGTRLMGLPESQTGGFQVMLALGIGVGSFAAGRLSAGHVELGLVPIGAVGLAAFGAALGIDHESPRRVFGDLFLLGVSSGFYIVPLQAFIQQRSPVAERGRVAAAGNFLCFSGVLLASAALWALDRRFHFDPAQVFVWGSMLAAFVALVMLRRLPDFFIRLLLLPFTRWVYSMRIVGLETVPREGPVLLVANHVSFVDALLIAMANQRLVRFMMLRSYYDLPVAGWLFRALGCVPVSSGDGPRALAESFKRAREYMLSGEAVCIFAEGEISRHGQMQRFKKGFERMVEGVEVPIVPVHLDQVWGSLFSFSEGRALFKKPRALPYPVTVSFDRPMPSTSSAFAVRQAILALGADAFHHRLVNSRPLPLEFLRRAKARPFSPCVSDSFGTDLNGLSTLVGAHLLAKALEPELGEAENVGVLLPTTAAGALANIGLALHGRVPVNLNYTAAKDVVDACIRKGKIGVVVTSRKFEEKLGWAPSAAKLVYLEDMKPRISAVSKALTAAAFLLTPASLLERCVFAKARKPLDSLATVMFTSGSTGVPKGVMLTHANVLSNVLAVEQVISLGRSDMLVGVLPFFHSFGFTGTLWLPLALGVPAAYHPNPLEPRKVGELMAEKKGTVLMGTPTFLLGWMRKIEAEKMKTLRYMVVGAEKLREEVGKAFEEKYGVVPLEGYGATELSPVAAINIPDLDWPGIKQKGTKPGTVGQPLPGVFMKVVDPDTGRELAADEPGLLLVKGPNVMKGYLDDPERTAEAMRDGFYVTGDIARIDEDGFVTLTDRLSRFSKIGGEMVPHVKVEEGLHEAVGALEACFVVAAVPDEKRGERLVVLHKPGADPAKALAGLSAKGLPNLWIPDRAAFHEVAEFPLLGSGKLDFQRLKAEAKRLEGL